MKEEFEPLDVITYACSSTLVSGSLFCSRDRRTENTFIKSLLPKLLFKIQDSSGVYEFFSVIP